MQVIVKTCYPWNTSNPSKSQCLRWKINCKECKLTFSSKIPMITCLHLATPSFSPETTISSFSTLAGGTLMRAPVSSISCLMFWLYGPQTNGWNAFNTGSLSKASLAWKKKKRNRIKTMRHALPRKHTHPHPQKLQLALSDINVMLRNS